MVEGDKKDKEIVGISIDLKLDVYDPLHLHPQDIGSRLITFELEGLDDVFSSVRNIILTTDSLPDVKYAFATLSRDESHRTMQTREPFSISDHKTVSIGDIIHLGVWSLDVWGPYRVTSRDRLRFFFTVVDDYTRLPTVVLSCRSPYEMVYGSKPSLFHLKTFGRLCFSTILNESDKFSARSDKDCKFYETVYLFKITSFTKEYIFEENGVSVLNFFNKESVGSPKSSKPNDDAGDTAVDGDKTATEQSNNLTL
ncbi:hypothetical protein Tco_1482546 [Tanacetum coccineum]